MIQQRQVVGGPLDGKIVATPDEAPDVMPYNEAGQYRQVTLSENVRIWSWAPIRTVRDRWTKRKPKVRWGVPKRPFGVVESRVQRP